MKKGKLFYVHKILFYFACYTDNRVFGAAGATGVYGDAAAGTTGMIGAAGATGAYSGAGSA